MVYTSTIVSVHEILCQREYHLCSHARKCLNIYKSLGLAFNHKLQSIFSVVTQLQILHHNCCCTVNKQKKKKTTKTLILITIKNYIKIKVYVCGWHIYFLFYEFLYKPSVIMCIYIYKGVALCNWHMCKLNILKF